MQPKGSGGDPSSCHDANGNTTSVDGPHGLVSYTYDAQGRRTSMSTPGGTVTYDYTHGRLSTVTDVDGGTTAYTYGPDSRLTAAVLSNGVTASLGHDAAGRLTSLEYFGPDGSVLDSFAYIYDPAGNGTSSSSGGGTETYSFDPLNRLVSAAVSGATTTWTYDPAGNRLTEATTGEPVETYLYDSVGQLTGVDGADYLYDEAGNLTLDDRSVYTYDAHGRLASVTDLVAGGVTGFVYDGDGFRSEITTPVETAALLWDRVSEMPEIVSDGATSYLHVPLQTVSYGAATNIGLEAVIGSIRHDVDSLGWALRTERLIRRRMRLRWLLELRSRRELGSGELARWE